MISFLNALGGVALILFGVRFLRKGLYKVVGHRLPVWVTRLTGGPFRSAFTGVIMGILTPSSTSNGLLAVHLVRDGLLAVNRAVVLLMGAYVGTTLLVHLVAADITHHVPIAVLFGVILFLGARSSTVRGGGQVILGISFVLMGVGTVGAIANELRGEQDLLEFVTLASRYPWLVAVLAAVMAAMLQSTTAVLAILIAIALQDHTLVTPVLVVASVVGVNVGISVIAVFAGWRDLNGRRFSIAAMILRTVVAVALLLAVRWSTTAVDVLPGATAQRIAIVHTTFNLIALLVSIPTAGGLMWIVRHVVRASRDQDSIAPQAIDDRWADDPRMAFAQTKREIGLAVRVTVSMLQDAWRSLERRDEALLRSVRERDDTVDQLERHVKAFLTRDLTNKLEPLEFRRRLLQLRFVGDLEAIADVIDKRICETAAKAARRGVRFSDSGWDELRAMFEAVIELLELAGAVFMEERRDLAHRLLTLKDEVRDQELRLRDQHYSRLQEGMKESFETTGLHLEILSQLKHIAHVASGVAYGILELAPESPAAP
ncbi:MAG: Na/Pi cotransporter family protein [Phycisphaerales bacterium]|nr:Na/Pi cotransporter family protein [Phycisphaerales bacterium]